MAENKVYRTAAYLRLSKGDTDVDGVEKAESNSISNQRLIIQRFLEQHPELTLADTYIDDGYTGTNYKRPELKRMLYDIDDGKIDCIVVKDLSRFGRERIETGKYISRVFKEKGIRFIAINDHYDSLTADGSETHLIMPIKALTNDNFSRDISLKVRSSLAVKKEKGEYVAPFAPYGYRKDPKDVNHLIIDETAAEVVRRIFARKIEGLSANAIAEELTKEGTPTPLDYKRSCGENFPGRRKSGKSPWRTSQIIRILQNEMYVGNMVQGKTSLVSYKVKKVIHKPREEWDIVEGTHEPIISKADYEIVKSLLARDVIRPRKADSENLFAGILFCGDCGSSLVRRKLPVKNGSVICYICSEYNRTGNCSRHTIRDEDLKDIVLESMNGMIRKLCQYDELARSLENLNIPKDAALARDAEIQKMKEELTKYGRLKSALYQDLKEGLINETQFDRYRSQYTEREIGLQNAIEAQKALIEKIYEKGIAADSILEQFKENPQVNELNHRLLVSLIDRILIYEDDTVEIVYRYTDELAKCEQILSTVSQRREHGTDKKEI